MLGSSADLGHSSGNSSLIIGVGSAGCRITSRLHDLGAKVHKFSYLSCDKDDLDFSAEGDKLLIPYEARGETTPAVIRGIGSRYLPEIRTLLRDSEIVFLVAGLGGKVGSGLAPLITSTASELGANVIGVAVMPYRFERAKHFYAGVALRHLRALAKGIIVVDNDEFLESAPKVPLLETYRQANENICSAINRIMRSSNGEEFGIGLIKFMDTVNHDGYSILSLQRSPSENSAEDAVSATVQSIYRTTGPGEASRAILYIVGDENLSAGDISASVSRLGSFLGGSTQVDYGMSMRGAGNLSAILLASGFKTTKFDEYDPLSNVLIGRELDFEPESTLTLQIEGLVQIE